MRVITGSAKGKKLTTFKTDKIRPTSDRIKEALFSIIGSKVIDCIFLDCFSGTGNIGIEALSRKARKCYFIEKHRESISIIKKNLNITHLMDNSNIISKDAVKGIEEIATYKEKMDIIFLDPPYLKGLIQPVLKAIVENKIIHEESWIIVEHSKRDILQEVPIGLECFKKQNYGNISLTFFKLEEI